MALSIIDFIEQEDGLTVEDVPPRVRERVDDALADLTGGPGGGPPQNPSAILVSKNLDGRDGFNNIQPAIDSADPGDAIFVEDGTYNEQLTIDKSLTITNAPGNSPVLQGPGTATGIHLRADDVTLQGLRVEQFNNGLEVDASDAVQGVTAEDCAFDDNSFGWYTKNDANQHQEVSSTFDDVTARNCSFNGNDEKGLYLEKLSNAEFDNIEIRNSGVLDSLPYPNGMDINLKFGNYENITIKNSAFYESGIEGSGALPNLYGALCIKARGTGGDSAYASGDQDTDAPAPTTLENVVVKNNTFEFESSTQSSSRTVAIRAGEGNELSEDPGGNIAQPTPGDELAVSDRNPKIPSGEGNEFINADEEVLDLTDIEIDRPNDDNEPIQVTLDGDTKFVSSPNPFAAFGFGDTWSTSSESPDGSSGSWATFPGSGKQGLYFGGQFSDFHDPNGDFPTYTVSEIDRIAYSLREPTALNGNDIYLSIYTVPEGDGDDSASWYDSRLQALPSDANNGSPNFTAGAWNRFTTEPSGNNTLNFYDSVRSVGDVGAGDQVTIDEFDSPIDWDGDGTSDHDYSDETVLAIALTNATNEPGLEAYLDNITLELTSGETLQIDLEP